MSLSIKIVFLFLSIFFLHCTPDDQNGEDIEDVNLGGETTIEGSFIAIFEQPAANLSEVEEKKHVEGDVAFGDKFVTAPNIINGGLGPIFNQNSCENCHVSNGRSPFPDSPSDQRGLLLRVSQGNDIDFGPKPIIGIGGQLQTKAIFGISPEANLSWKTVNEIKEYVDGEKITLSKYIFDISNTYLPVSGQIDYSPRIAPPMIGLGLLEAILENDILAGADEFDTNKDGISGRPNWVYNYKTQKKELGRFGWKAGHPTLLQQTASAYNEDMGITSPYFPVESSFGQIQYTDQNDDPEINETTLENATFYPQSLAVPMRRNFNDPIVQKGKKIFNQIKCGSCHKSTAFTTGNNHEYGFLNNQKIFPYTDLLLHDMGEGLADNRPDFVANGNEWRTPPLWGLGLTKIVGGPKANYLHDGRASTLEEAILWHGGEAEMSAEKFRALSKSDRNALIKFLESL